MRDPNNLINVYSSKERNNYLLIENVPEFDIEDYDLLDDKDFKKYIESIEKICRNSYEYRQMVNFLRENLWMNKCSFYENVSNEASAKIKIHIHHDPFSLFDICLIVFRKRIAYGESILNELVAKEVMFLHYKLLVGLVPLAETPHKLVHNQYLFVPVDKVFGNYMKFKNMYEEFMTSEQIDLFDRIMESSKNMTLDTEVLDQNFIYLDFSEQEYKLPDLNTVIEDIEQSMRENKGETSDGMIDPIVIHNKNN